VEERGRGEVSKEGCLKEVQGTSHEAMSRPPIPWLDIRASKGLSRRSSLGIIGGG
jgi:hypothetical protein